MGVLKFDLNARVWTWFLQQPSPGAVYRVRLKSGATFVGQVAAYSSDPSDDRQDLVLEFYSAVAADAIATPVFGSEAMILSRDDIETIERLRVTIPEPTQQGDGGRDQDHAE